MAQKIVSFVTERKLLVIIIVLIITLSVADRNFLTVRSLYSIFDHITINGIMSAGNTVLLISGYIDLSVCSFMSSLSIAGTR